MSIAEVNAAWDKEEKAGISAVLERNRQHLEKINALQELAGDAMFRDYRKELVKEVQSLKDALCNPSTPNIPFLQGQIAGLRLAIHFFEMRGEEARRVQDESELLKNELDLLEDHVTTYGGEGVAGATPN